MRANRTSALTAVSCVIGIFASCASEKKEAPPPTVVETKVPHEKREGSVLVMPLRAGEGSDPAALAGLDAQLVIALDDLGPYNVVTPKDIGAQLEAEQMKDLIGCDEINCATQIGGALGARYLMHGSVVPFEDHALLTVTLIDTKEQKVSGRGDAKLALNESFAGGQSVERAVRKLLELPLPAEEDAAPISMPSEPEPCTGDTVRFEADGPCENAFGRSYRLTLEAVHIAEYKPDGSCWDTGWDIGCGEPDPTVVLSLDGKAIIKTVAAKDVFDATFNQSVEIGLRPGSALSLALADSDVLENDAVLECTVDPLTADLLRSGRFSCAKDLGSASVTFTPLPAAATDASAGGGAER